MIPTSLYDLFDPDRLGWLYYRDGEGQQILADDVKRIWNADPAYRSDPLLQEYMSLALDGSLRRPRGRPARTPMDVFKLQMAEVLIDNWSAEIKEERKKAGIKGGRTLEEPRVAAANEVGRYLGIVQGRSLLTAISNMNNAHV